MSTPEWRDESAYEYLNELSVEGLAWEFLRRNADYRREYETAANDGSPALESGGEPGSMSDWGLVFRGRPRRHRA